MRRLLRSTISDPVQAGIRAFGEVSDIMERRETAPMRRELMAQELAERRLRTERERGSMEFEKKTRAEWERILGRQHATEENIDLLKDLTTTQIEIDAAETEGREPTFTDKQRDSILKMWGKGQVFNPNKNLDEQVSAIQNIQKFMNDNASQLTQGGRLDRDKYPDVFQSFDKVFEDQINRGSDKHGNTVETHGVKKRVKSVFIDPRDQSLAFSLEVETPVKDGQVFKHIGDRTPIFTVNANAAGMVEQGNIDLSKRPVVRNADGSISTVLSRGFGTKENGQEVEVLLPLVSDDGRIIDDKEAWAKYQKDGKHLGKFKTIADASRYAEQLHADRMWNDDIKEYSAKGQASTKYDAPMTFDRSGTDPNARVVKLPIGIFDRYLSGHASLGSMIQQLRAQLKPEEFAAQMEKIKKIKAENVAISKAMGKVDTSKGVGEQRKQFITEFTKLYPEASIKDTADLAKTLIVERQPLTSPIGRMQQDRTRLINQGYSPDDPQVKEIDAAIKKATQETKKPSAIEEFEEVEKMTPEKKKRYMTFERQKLGAKEKPKIEIKMDDQGNMLRVDVDTGKATPVIDATGKPIKGKKELTTADMNLIMRKSKAVNEGIKGDVDIGESRESEVSEYAEALLKANPSLGVKEVINQTKKDLGIEKKWTEDELKRDLKAHGKTDREVKDYIKRAKEAGKL